MIWRISTTIVVIAALAACASPQRQRIERERAAATEFLARQGSIGDPGRVAAADFAFARMAEEEGTWTAFRAYAAPDAVMDAPGGFAPASELLSGLEDPPEPIRWAPTDVWSSCDGTLAVTLGRFLRPNGLVGDYVTVWELQSDNSYKWIYDTGTPDDPQPAPEVEEELPEDAIVVEGLTSIEGRIADCQSQPEAMAEGEGLFERVALLESGQAEDGSLIYFRELNHDGSRRVSVLWWREGTWQQAVDLTIPAPGQ